MANAFFVFQGFLPPTAKDENGVEYLPLGVPNRDGRAWFIDASAVELESGEVVNAGKYTILLADAILEDKAKEIEGYLGCAKSGVPFQMPDYVDFSIVTGDESSRVRVERGNKCEEIKRDVSAMEFGE